MDTANMEPRPNLGEGVYASSQTGQSYMMVTAVAKLLGMSKWAISKRVKRSGVGHHYQPPGAIKPFTLVPRLIVAYWVMWDKWDLAREMAGRLEWPFNPPIIAGWKGQFGPRSARYDWAGNHLLGPFPDWVTEAQQSGGQSQTTEPHQQSEDPEESWDWDYDLATLEEKSFEAHLKERQAKREKEAEREAQIRRFVREIESGLSS